MVIATQWDGVFEDMSAAAYHTRRLGVVSKSTLDHIARSPAHYRQWFDSPDEATPAMEFGAAFHCRLLEPDVFEKAYVVEPDFGDKRFKENKAAHQAWLADNAGKTPIDAADDEAMSGMVAAIKAHPLASRMLTDGKPELTVRWTDKATGLRCQCRGDFYAPRVRMLADIKTAEDARPEEWRRSVSRFRYHVQDALYREGFTAAEVPIDHFVFIVVEKKPPFGISVIALDTEAVGRGYQAARRDIETMAECVKNDTWPGYTTSIQTLDLPPWAA